MQTDRELYTLRNASVVIHELDDKSIEVFYKGKKLALKTYEEQQKQIGEVDSKHLNAVVDELVTMSEGKREYKPSKNHPWKRFVKKNHGVIRI